MTDYPKPPSYGEKPPSYGKKPPAYEGGAAFYAEKPSRQAIYAKKPRKSALYAEKPPAAYYGDKPEPQA